MNDNCFPEDMVNKSAILSNIPNRFCNIRKYSFKGEGCINNLNHNKRLIKSCHHNQNRTDFQASLGMLQRKVHIKLYLRVHGQRSFKIGPISKLFPLLCLFLSLFCSSPGASLKCLIRCSYSKI